jgi:hypothetical protein
LTTEKVDVSRYDNFVLGIYYKMITVTADWSGKEKIIKKQKFNRDTGLLVYNADQNAVTEDITIPEYRLTIEDSISTAKGCKVTRTDGSKYTVFGVQGKYEGQDVIWEYMYTIPNGNISLKSSANIYLTNESESVYQKRKIKSNNLLKAAAIRKAALLPGETIGTAE